MSKQLRIWLFVLIGSLLASSSLLAEGVITMTTSKRVGESLYIGIEANGNVSIEGVKESARTDGAKHFYTLTNQTVIIRGDVAELDCYDNQLTSLNLSGCASLTKLDCSRNQLTSLDLSGSTALTTLNCSLNQINRDGMTKLVNSLPDRKGMSSGTLKVVGYSSKKKDKNWCSFADVAIAIEKNWEILKYVNDKSRWVSYSGIGEGVITMTTSKAVEERIGLRIVVNGDVLIEGVSEKPYLSDRYSENYTLTSQTITIRGDVIELNCSKSQLTSLDVSGCTALTTLDCEGNQLTSLDVSGCTALTTLYCYDNQLTSLNLSGCASLKKLDCSNNQLTSLDLSGCTALKTLNCSLNQINRDGMTKLVNSLPDRKGMSSGTLKVVDYSSKKKDKNWCSFADVAIAIEKNWEVLKYVDDKDRWVSYSGIGEGVITMTTSKAVGEKIGLTIKVNDNVTIEGIKELPQTGDWKADYTLTSQTITIRGDVTELSCYENQLISLDASGCTALTELDCYNNQLTSLDASGCSALTTLDCKNNQLTSLNLSGCTALTKLRCGWNSLTSLDVSGCTALTELDCRRNSLTSLDVSGCISLTKLSCSYNQLTRLDVSDCTALTELKCYKNRLKGEAMTQMVVGLSDRSEKKSGSLYVVCDESDENNILRSDVLTAFRKNWRVFKYIVNTRKSVLYSGASDDDEIVMTITQEQYLEGGIRLAILADGDVTIEGVHERRIFTDGSEHTYTLAGTQITIRGNVSELDCSKNQLTNIDVSKSTSLWILRCSDNKLTSLDLSDCTFLTTLYCSRNPLTSINLSNCTSLKEFTWGKGKLTSLKVSGCTSLTKLSCYDNQLTSLDMSGCTALTQLDCSNNKLTSLDVSGCTALTELWCSRNQLTSLDLSQNNALTELDCSRNKLETLDLSVCTRLESLTCYWNKIRGNAVAQLVESLPDRYGKEPGKFYFVYYSEYEYEENFCYRPAVGRANDKNWRPQKGHNSRYQDSWEDYFGVIDEGVVMMYTAQEVGSQITLTLEAKGDVAIDGVKGVPETDGKPHQYTLISQDVTIRGYVTKLHCSGNKLTSLDLSTTVPLVELDCSNNQLTSLDVSHNAAVTSLACYRNQIKGEAMALLIKGLPQLPLRSTHLFGIVSNAADEGNVFLKADVERVRDKGWSPMKWDEERQRYEPYAGKETESFAVMLTKEGKGTISATGADDLNAVAYGTELTIVATPSEGYELISLTAGEEDILASKKIVVTDNVTVKATFDEATFAVSLKKEGEGTISATGADDLTAVAYGTELTIVATPATGYELTALTANGKDILATKKVVIKGATEVKATFVDHTGVETTVTQQTQLYPNPATDYVIVEGVAPASEVTLHSMTGERLYAGRADSRGVLQIDLTPYADGVYLVCVAGETYRVVVRR